MHCADHLACYEGCAPADACKQHFNGDKTSLAAAARAYVQQVAMHVALPLTVDPEGWVQATGVLWGGTLRSGSSSARGCRQRPCRACAPSASSACRRPERTWAPTPGRCFSPQTSTPYIPSSEDMASAWVTCALEGNAPCDRQGVHILSLSGLCAQRECATYSRGT